MIACRDYIHKGISNSPSSKHRILAMGRGGRLVFKWCPPILRESGKIMLREARGLPEVMSLCLVPFGFRVDLLISSKLDFARFIADLELNSPKGWETASLVPSMPTLKAIFSSH